MCSCENTFNFCESCLHHYAIYKIKNFEEVLCPKEGCISHLDILTAFFKQLPVDIQKRHHQYLEQVKAMNNPQIKLCLKESCKGSLTALKDSMACKYTCLSAHVHCTVH